MSSPTERELLIAAMKVDFALPQLMNLAKRYRDIEDEMRLDDETAVQLPEIAATNGAFDMIVEMLKAILPSMSGSV